MSDTTALLKKVEFGLDVQQFLDGKIGKYLVGKAEAEIAEAVEKLKKADPTKPVVITELQNAIHRAESFQYWLAEGMQEGMNAEEALHQQDA